MSWNWLRMALAAGALLVVFGCEERQPWLPFRTNIKIPLVEVSRTASPKSPFDVPSVVLVVRIRQRWEIEETDTHGQSIEPSRFWTAARADLVEIVRVNERQPTDPDLSKYRLVIDQRERPITPFRFEFGRPYLLLLNPSKRPFFLDYQASQVGYDSYVLAVPQGGFEIVDGRLVPLVSGGDLDAYAGRDANEVIMELQPK